MHEGPGKLNLCKDPRSVMFPFCNILMWIKVMNCGMSWLRYGTIIIVSQNDNPSLHQNQCQRKMFEVPLSSFVFPLFCLCLAGARLLCGFYSIDIPNNTSCSSTMFAHLQHLFHFPLVLGHRLVWSMMAVV
jgi:hypothetical protein